MPYSNRRYNEGRRGAHPYLPPPIPALPDASEMSPRSSGNLVVTHTHQEYSVVVRPIEPAREVSEFKQHLSAVNNLLGPIMENYVFQNDRLNQLESQNQELATDNTIVSSRMFELQREKEELETHYQGLLKNEKDELEVLRNDLKTWKENAMRSSDQIEQINVQLAERQKTIDSQKGEIETLSKSIENAQNTLDEAKKEVKGAKEMVQVLKKIVEDLEVENKRQTKLDTDVQDRNTELKTRNEELQQQLKGFEADLRKQKKQSSQWTDSEKKLKEDLHAKEEKVKAQSKQIEKLVTEIEGLKKKKDQVEDKLKEELETKKRIFEEHMEFYTRPSLLNKLLQEKLQTDGKVNGKAAKAEPGMEKVSKDVKKSEVN